MLKCLSKMPLSQRLACDEIMQSTSMFEQTSNVPATCTCVSIAILINFDSPPFLSGVVKMGPKKVPAQVPLFQDEEEERAEDEEEYEEGAEDYGMEDEEAWPLAEEDEEEEKEEDEEIREAAKDKPKVKAKAKPKTKAEPVVKSILKIGKPKGKPKGKPTPPPWRADASADAVETKSQAPKGKPKGKAKAGPGTKLKGPKAKGKGKGSLPAPSTPHSLPSVSFQDAMSAYCRSPTRRDQQARQKARMKEEPKEPVVDGEAERRKLWGRFDRSLAVSGSSRAPKCPERLRLQIMDGPSSSLRMDLFKIYVQCGGDWGETEKSHEKSMTNENGEGTTERWLMLSQMEKLYRDKTIAAAMADLCQNEDGKHRNHPKLPRLEMAKQFLVEVEDDVWDRTFSQDKQMHRIKGNLDLPSAAAIAGGRGPSMRVADASSRGGASSADAQSAGSAGTQRVASSADAPADAQVGKAATDAPRRGGGAVIDPTLELRKDKLKAKAKAKPKKEVSPAKTWFKNIQEDLGKVKAAIRQCETDQEIPTGVCLEFKTFFESKVPAMTHARGELQEVCDGDKSFESLEENYFQTLGNTVKEVHAKLLAWKTLVASYASAKRAMVKKESKVQGSAAQPNLKAD